MKLSRPKKVLLIILIAFSGLILLLFISVNLPYGHRFITNRVNNILAGAGIPIHITSISSIYPESITVKGVTLTGSQRDTIVYAGEIQADFVPLALLKKRVIISDIYLGDAKINFSRKNNNLNITEAFSKGRKDGVSQPVKKKKWEVSIGKADIAGIRFQMNDSLSGIRINQKIGELKITLNKMSLQKHTLLVHSLEITGASGSITINSHPEKRDTTNGILWNIGLDKIAMNKINLGFNNKIGKLKIDLVLDEASAGINKMDFKNKMIDFGKISFSQTSLVLMTNNMKDKQKASKKGMTRIFPWELEAGGINLENITFRLSNYSDSVPAFGITDLALKLSDLKLNNNEIGLDIDKTMFKLDNGFSMKEMKGAVESHSGKTSLNLSVETTNSLFNIESKADGNLLDLLSHPFEIRKAALSISDTELSLKDLLYFKPELKENPVFSALDKTPFSVNVNMKFQDSVIDIPEIRIYNDKNLRITLAGKIENPFIKGKEKGELNLAIPDVDVVWLKSILKESGLKKELPEFSSLSLTAYLSGSLKSTDFNIGLSGDLGKTDIAGTIDYENDIFQVKSVFRDVLPGKILRNSLLGSFNGSVEVKGKGFRHKGLVANIVAVVDSLGFKGYTYTRTWLECKIDRQNYDVNLNIDDPFLRCNLAASLNTADSTLAVKSTGSFSAQLNKLNLCKDPLGIDGNIKVDFKKSHNLIQSDLTVSGLKINTSGDNSILPETKIAFNSDSLKTLLSAGSDFFNIKVEIEKPLSELGFILPAYRHYAETIIDSSLQDRLKRISLLPEMKVVIRINQHKALGLILNDTTFHFGNFEFKGTNNPIADRINYNLSVKGIKYKNINIGNLSARLTDSASTMNLLVKAENCSLFSRQLNKIHIINRFSNRQGLTDFTVFEKTDKILYNFEINSRIDSTGIIFSVPSKQLIMNGMKWQMDTPDLFTFNRSVKAFLVSLRMNTNSSLIKITSDKTGGLHTWFEMNNVDIASLLPVALIQGNPAGLISGKADFFSGLNNEKEIHSDLNFKDISWSDINFRLLTLKGNFKSDTPKDYLVDLTAILDSSIISLKASKPAEGNRKINTEFSNISIESFQPFVKKILSDLKGHISGNLNIVSTNDIENFKGELNINKANMRIKFLNSNYRIPDDRILFDGRKVIFDKIRVLDSLKNELFVDGSLDFIKPKEISTDIEVSSSKLQIMNTTEKENASLFGKIFIDSRLSIKGPLTSPKLKGKILLTGGTEIFFKQKEDLKLSESEKVVTFVSANPANSEKKPRSDAKKSINTKASVDAIVQIDPDTKINVSLSKRMFNISLMIKGGGELNYNMLANKDADLAGKYEISEGSADVKITGWPNKSFRITRGGFVRWDGKLEDPELNFEAVNRVRSSYTNPVDNKQHDVDFNVTLKLTNRLSILDVLFTINTPDQYLMSIINTLSPEEQMRQAITILLFAKIDLPGISTSSDYMTEQVNQLVASQLNQLTKTTIQGIDISFGIDSYVQSTSSGGQETKTSLSYEVKKALLNNRAQIEVSGRINDANKQPGASDLSLNNVSFEYRLDSAGTKFLKVYNEHTYEDVFEGEVIKTGVGIIYRKSYRNLGDIWKKDEKSIQPKNQDK